MRVVGTPAQAAVYAGDGVVGALSVAPCRDDELEEDEGKRKESRPPGDRSTRPGERLRVPLLTPQLAGELREPYVMTKTEEMTPKSTSEM